HAFHIKTIKASAGLVFKQNFSYGPSIKELELIAQTRPIITLHNKNGQSINKYAWPKNISLLIGQEGLGIPFTLSNLPSLTIPTQAAVESLNATMAASIAFYSYYSYHIKASQIKL
ncbi:MAG: RNA methyltransferase, partial [bacterium]|nr:RNA methyltransferase [bacterium]